ncbi:anion transporter [Saccharopolyspora erythraea NRRL 2338]|uniref:Integral membrane transporter n=2 Tax=Saccharopolyspora erythraea TaxID=1836 RepID=A4F5X8_SACEN|nr:SLC13 family permease [Saccharopolyspora erythraea]EQD83990.1 transporter [Saccharopolyspora erythraea D]PFG93251.1 anion transporter [Saccharopolyspora erythraea NRRL 2338]QRK90103.1 anion permease [Saccharopolyspora erythraea]CAL99452.1 integral membrane transporter [Saccharopolyspora erythraea NRRL 2338]
MNVGQQGGDHRIAGRVHGDERGVDYRTPARPRAAEPPRRETGWAVGLTAAALALLGGVSLLLLPAEQARAAGTVLVFAAAVAGWISKRFDDTHVALAAAAAVVAIGALEPDEMFETLGSEQIWLLVAAFVLAAGISRTGLPARLAVSLICRARSARALVHLVSAGLVVTALLIPSTSGRAALVLPVFTALASAFAGRPRLVRALSLLFPTVVLLSAVATLVGAGAHLITSQILDEATGAGIGFAQWLLWGLPLAVVSSHVAAELVLLLFTRRADRTARLRVDGAGLRERMGIPERVQRHELRAAALLGAVVVLWSTESLHPFPPALVALAGALLITAPKVGTVRIGAAVSEIPWSTLLFMAATTALGLALTESGAASWAAELLLSGSGSTLLVSVVVLSTLAHLLVQSRSARSSVLIPLVVPAAAAAGMNPAALAFASTAAAGFCHTLPSSAKPVAMFAAVPDVPTYTARDLLKLSALLAPVLAALVLLFATQVWPVLGLPLR